VNTVTQQPEGDVGVQQDPHASKASMSHWGVSSKSSAIQILPFRPVTLEDVRSLDDDE